MGERVTQESNPEFWASLYSQWESEGRPGWVVRRSGAEMWRVIQLTSGSMAFDEESTQNYYESTSF